MTTDYCSIKHHFDKLILGGYPNSNGLEHIRDTYETMFNTNINLYDVYQTPVRLSNNPISKIITLVGGPSSEESKLKSGIMCSDNGIVYTTVFSNDIFKIDSTTVNYYIYRIYNYINSIIGMDTFYKSDPLAIANPHIAFIKSLPFYLTYHHVKKCIPCDIDDDIFIDILEKYIVAGDEAVKVLKSVESNMYTDKEENIYSAMTANNTVDLFW